MVKRMLATSSNHGAGRLVGILIMDLLDLIQRGEEDVEELGVEVLPSMFGHEFDGVIEGEGGLVDPLCGEGIEGSRRSQRFVLPPESHSPFNLRGYPLPSQRSW